MTLRDLGVVLPGEKLELYVKAINATDCTVDQNVGSLGPASGVMGASRIVDPPAGMTTYTVTCSGPAGPKSLPWLVKRL